MSSMGSGKVSSGTGSACLDTATVPLVLATAYGYDPTEPDGTLYLHGSIAGRLLTAALEQTICVTITHADGLVLALTRIRDTTRAVQSELKPGPGEPADGARQVARAAIDEMHENSARILERRELDALRRDWNPQESEA